MRKKKTVYILGAGASASARIPTQAGILSLIFSVDRSAFEIPLQTADFLLLDIKRAPQIIADHYEKFDEYRKSLGEFIVNNFSSDSIAIRYSGLIRIANNTAGLNAEEEKKKEEVLLEAYSIVKRVKVTLEDLFTIFDSVSAGRQHFRLYSPQKMDELHQQLKLCIIYALSLSISTKCNYDDYDAFSKFLLEQRNKSKQEEDPFSVITTNWDDLLIQSLFNHCRSHNSEQRLSNKMVFPDLCFYNYDLSNNQRHIPSTQIRARGYKNIKVLKMHGSLAWLECPRCGRIFTDFDNEIAAEEFSDIPCPFCKEELQPGLTDFDIPKLRNLIITPTFLKSLDNLSLKNIWQNAYIDISEATHIVFIGYSFPAADFEMRCLLKKAIRNDARITVVLRDTSDPEKRKSILLKQGVSLEETEKIVERMELPPQRYNSFFGEERVNFYFNGFGSYIKSLRGLE